VGRWSGASRRSQLGTRRPRCTDDACDTVAPTHEPPNPEARIVTSLTHDSPELARTYDRLSDSQFEGGKRLVDRLGLKAGERVLDIGCGTGRLARWIAGVVGPDGVVGIDPLVDRVEVARAAAPGIAFEVGQAEDLSAFGGESFDAVCMSAVFHWVSDKPRALAEVRRVLRPGGRLGLTTLPRDLRPSSTTTLVCAEILSQDPYIGRVEPAGLALAQVGNLLSDLVALVLEARLEVLELLVVRRTQTFSSGEEAVEFLQSSSFGNFLRLVPDDLRASFRRDIAGAFEARRGPGGISLNDHGTLLVAARN
jgi:arsenite methyltransferase